MRILETLYEDRNNVTNSRINSKVTGSADIVGDAELDTEIDSFENEDQAAASR
jgi:hypothetical protein